VKTCAAIACRAYSSRLFGKPMQLVGDRPILTHLIEQMKMAKRLDEVVLAISEGSDAGLFIDYANEHGYKYVVGAGRDVQYRLIMAAESVGAEVILRNTSENPFIYWENLDDVIEAHIAHGNDITVTEKLPIASFVEVISLKALKKAHDLGDERTCSELVTLYFAEHLDQFQIERIAPPPELAHPEIRFAVDDPLDLVMIRKIWDELNNGRDMIPLHEIVDYWKATPKVQKVLSSKNTLFIWG
jgi:spore coat polysaccharide biosynthesis protein SpsF